MNNKNTETRNENWRMHNYMEESRNPSISRLDGYYNHYSSPQYVNDYMQGGYVYPSMLPPYRHNEPSLPSQNLQYINSPGLMTPEAYSKYYKQTQNYMAPDPRLCIKGYSNLNHFYSHPNDYRSHHPYHSAELQNSTDVHGVPLPLAFQPSYGNDSLGRLQKVAKSKQLIVIESDQENINHFNHQQIKASIEKKEEKPFKQLRETKMQPKQKNFSQLVQQQKKQIMAHSIVYPIATSLISESKQMIMHQQQDKKIHCAPFTKLSDLSSIQLGIREVIPYQFVQRLKEQILQQLQIAEMPDNMMKLFIKYKTLQMSSKYQEDEQMSVKIFNLLKIYRAIIQFQKQRKYFIDHIIGEQIFQGFNFNKKPTLKKTNLLDSRNRSQEITPEDRENLKFKISLDQNKQKIHQQENYSLKQKQSSLSTYPAKIKKISKRQSSDHNSDEISFNAKGKYIEKQQYENHTNLCERRLRDRKKKKNKRQKYDKSYESQQFKELIQKEKDKINIPKIQQLPAIQNNKVQIQLSHEDEGLIEKIKGWAEKTVLADAIEQKHKKSLEKVKSISTFDNSFKIDPFRIIKKDDASSVTKKYKDRSSKASENAFRQMLNEKILQAKSCKSNNLPNLITFSTSNNLSEVQKEQFQKQLTHMIKQLKNNDSHGKIRIGKQYYQAKMPNFIQSQKELNLLIREKRQKLMERKMSVLTF